MTAGLGNVLFQEELRMQQAAALQWHAMVPLYEGKKKSTSHYVGHSLRQLILECYNIIISKNVMLFLYTGTYSQRWFSIFSKI
jgi:hypothetical protein